ncbi:DUF1707 domain-containing protein [Phytohabitans sp. ZYX-F-186]|uniref:DUF1707 domain-containing protein n=1 Tax=Phytohabitans maris TaxID=3071409 RepID=A0ABU0Z8I2_9ACTN|nr:DUF1707 domain-containing protein [Phytohabitans sp. ZYX-F-186]MDQ7903371.1 DUF1707 domain-containing protein [Phytohabitans sp. ZYX-F-186]
MDQRDRMRAADSDREAVVERLRTALNEGRLELHEFDERAAEAYRAKTYADLDRLLTDLPGVAPASRSQLAPVPPPAAAAPERGTVPRWLATIWGAWAAAVGINVVIWLLVSISNADLAYFWPMWVAGPWGVILVVATIGGLSSGEPQRWADKQARRRDRRRRRDR